MLQKIIFQAVSEDRMKNAKRLRDGDDYHGGFMHKTLAVWMLSLVVAMFTAQAAVLLQEDFSGATPGANSSLAGTQFQVTSGAVDIVGVLNGSFFQCANNPTGNCIDMVGSPGVGHISSIPTFNLIAGDTYTISFGYILQGFVAGNTPTSDFTVGLGTFSQILTAIPVVQNGSLTFSPGSNQTGAALTFATDTAPDDVHGAVLDHIVLTETRGTAVPEPSSLALLAIGVGLLGIAKRL
jgi:hypothetical protein